MQSNDFSTEESIKLLLENLSNSGISELEEQIFTMMQNKVNFLCQQGSMLHQFSSICNEKREYIQEELRKLATSVANQKINNHKDLVDAILFAVLSMLSKQTDSSQEQDLQEINSAEKKDKEKLSEILKQSARNHSDRIQKNEMLKKEDILKINDSKRQKIVNQINNMAKIDNTSSEKSSVITHNSSPNISKTRRI